jgi:hypothetical protein
MRSVTSWHWLQIAASNPSTGLRQQRVELARLIGEGLGQISGAGG